MKKIYTLIVALVATVSAMAQGHGAMNFVGTSTFYVVGMQESTTTQVENDKVILTLTGTGSKQAEIVFPDMGYNHQGSEMSLKSFTANSGVDYVMTGSFMTGDMAFDWAEGEFSTTTTGADGFEKAVSGKMSSKYAHSAQKLEVTAEFTYGAMPFPIHYEFVGNYQKVTGVENVNANVNDNHNHNPDVNQAYNLMGQRVGDNAKGVVITGGKKVIK